MWYLYILRCSDDSLYTGITTDIQRRLKEHREGEGSKYVRSRLPCRIVYKEKLDGRSDALKRESDIKSLSKKEKERLVSKNDSEY
ncbi:MAG: GIY-YIG nuclease family protein [Thermoplasmatota archaeon]